jgi:hypothetical protein
MNEPNIPTGQLPAADRQLFSVGHLCAMFQRAPATLLGILSAAGHSPTLMLNDVSYFGGRAVLAIEHALRGEGGSRE